MPEKTDILEQFESGLNITKSLLYLAAFIFIAWLVIPTLYELEDKITPKNISKLNLGFVEITLNKEISAFSDQSPPIMAGSETNLSIVDKSTSGKLSNILKENPNARFDVLRITEGKTYKGEILFAYINKLGTKYIVFENNDNAFEGLISASNFTSQISSRSYYNYRQLKKLSGIDKNSSNPKDTVGEILHKMQDSGRVNIAIVEGSTFVSVANRDDLVAQIVTYKLTE